MMKHPAGTQSSTRNYFSVRQVIPLGGFRKVDLVHFPSFLFMCYFGTAHGMGSIFQQVGLLQGNLTSGVAL